MKRICVLVVFGLVVVAFNVQSAWAISALQKQFVDTYKDAKFLEEAKKAKCNVCHFGKKKANRNDYGKALSKFFTKDDYKKLKDDKPALKKKIEDAFKACLKEKSGSGKTFGELIKAGKLPGTAPEPPPGE